MRDCPTTARATTATNCVIRSDLTDAEWAHIEPLIPPGKPGGGKRRVGYEAAR